MNEKLRQSLDERLSGMCLGEAEQAAIFRQIREKEATNVKHVKRGSALLALAAAMLILLAGTALAVTSRQQPDLIIPSTENEPAGFSATPAARYENEYFTLTIDTAQWVGQDAAFTGTIRLKEPEKHMLLLEGHTPPGDPSRTPIPVTLNAAGRTTMPDGVMLVLGSLNAPVDVLSMTSEAASFRVAGVMDDTSVTEAEMLCWINYLPPAGDTELTEEISFPIRQSRTQQEEILLEDEMITATLVSAAYDGSQAEVVIDLKPTKPWYTLGDAQEDKAALIAHMETVRAYACASREEALEMEEHRQPPIAELPVEARPQGEALRCTIRGTLPESGAAVTLYAMVSVHSQAAELHDNTSSVHYAELIFTLANPAVSSREISYADIINDLSKDPTTIVLMEDSWFDGYTGEVTLRIFPAKSSMKLALKPNEDGTPSDSTWVVSLNYDKADRLAPDPTTIDLKQEANGDILARIHYHDAEARFNSDRSLYLPIILTLTNEHNWTASMESFKFNLPVSVLQHYSELPIINQPGDSPRCRASMLSTSRNRYIGIIMEDYSPGSIARLYHDQMYGTPELPVLRLLDSANQEIAAGSFIWFSGDTLNEDPRPLFPYEFDESRAYYVAALRFDSATALPDTLHVEIGWENGTEPASTLTLRIP